MRDRVPTYPGRVTLVPVPGQENTFDMVRADEPIEPGSIWNKANVLPDEVCAAIGISSTSEPRDAFRALASGVTWQKIATFATAGAFTWTAPDLNNGQPYEIGVVIIGGGQSGSAAAKVQSGGGSDGALPGVSGGAISYILTVTPNLSYQLVVGAGGESVVAKATSSNGSSGVSTTGKRGGSSSFNEVSATSSDGSGQCVFSMSDPYMYFGGVNVPIPLSCFNPFENKRMLGCGGKATTVYSGTTTTSGAKYPGTGLGGGDGVATAGTSISGTALFARGGDANLPGCGGGAASVVNQNTAAIAQATSGKGADGAVMIYVRKAAS